MAKELPYFRFTAQEWQNGDISLESYEYKGLFIDICAYYWLKDCSLTLAMLQKKFSNDKEHVNYLVDLLIIDWCEESDSIQINFLDEQYDLLSEKRKKRSEAGRIGGLRKSSNAKAMLNQNPSYKDKDKYKENNKDNTFLKRVYFDKSKELDEAFKDYLRLRIKSKFTMTDRAINALVNKLRAMSNGNVKDAIKLIDSAIIGKWKTFYTSDK